MKSLSRLILALFSKANYLESEQRCKLGVVLSNFFNHRFSVVAGHE